MTPSQKQAVRREHSRTVLLRVVTGYFVAGAVWIRIGNVWSCDKAAPIIRWMVGMNLERAKNKLLNMGAKWEWITDRKERGGGMKH